MKDKTMKLNPTQATWAINFKHTLLENKSYQNTKWDIKAL
jgi:hypothetical protein